MLVAFLPLDDRPCNVIFPRMLADVGGIDLRIAERNAEIEKVLGRCGSAILSVDRFVFGGLVESREPGLTPALAMERMVKLERILKQYSGSTYLFTILMRQAPSAFSPEEEEKARLVKEASMSAANKGRQKAILRRLAPRVWRDYLECRKRNLAVNRQAIRLGEKGLAEFVVVGLDDLSSRGLNRRERMRIEVFIKAKKLSRKVMVAPGADEMGVVLLARSCLRHAQLRPRIYVLYSSPDPDRFRLRYEDRVLSRLVARHIQLVGGTRVEEARTADLLLFIHAPQEDQLDVPRRSWPRVDRRWLARLSASLEKGKPCLLADLRYANGADASLMQALARNADLSRLYSFCAWNTAANALGIALAHGVLRWLSVSRGSQAKNENEAHVRFLLLRFLEDWFYQAEIRPHLSTRVPASGVSNLAEEITGALRALASQHLKNVASHLRIGGVRFPWGRLFDIEIPFETGVPAGKKEK